MVRRMGKGNEVGGVKYGGPLQIPTSLMISFQIQVDKYDKIR
jgi:hypothetical protein